MKKISSLELVKKKCLRLCPKIENYNCLKELF